MNILNQQQKLSVLHFLIHNHKFQQIVKAALNPIVSNRLLTEYGCSMTSNNTQKLTQNQIKSMDKDLKRFSLEQIIQLRGSHEHRVKYHQNPLLIEKLLIKYKTESSITPSARKRLWLQFTQIYQRPNFYENLAAIQIWPEYSSIIQKDIARTQATPKTKNKIRELLYSFAKYNPYIGYIQGMNHIACFLLQQPQNQQEQIYSMSTEQAFFIFKYLTEEILPVDYYTDMKNIVAYLRIFLELLHQTNRKVYDKIKELMSVFQINFVLMLSVVFQEFVCIFTKGKIGKKVVQVIWDLLLLQGIPVIFKAGIVIFDYLQQTVLSVNSFQQYSTKIQQKLKQITDHIHFKKRIQQIYLSTRMIQILNAAILDQLRRQQQKSDEQNRARRCNDKSNTNKSKNNKKYEREYVCDERWNFCVETLQQHRKSNYSYQFLVFKSSQPINIIPGYLEKLDRQYFQPSQSLEFVDGGMIGRIPHSCRPKSETLTESSVSLKNGQKQQFLMQTPEKNQSVDSNKSDISASNPIFSSVNTNTNTTKNSRLRQQIQNNQQKIREQAAKKIISSTNQKQSRGLGKSESVAFMIDMIQNASVTDLEQLYDLQQLDRKFL